MFVVGKSAESSAPDGAHMHVFAGPLRFLSPKLLASPIGNLVFDKPVVRVVAA